MSILFAIGIACFGLGYGLASYHARKEMNELSDRLIPLFDLAEQNAATVQRINSSLNRIKNFSQTP